MKTSKKILLFTAGLIIVLLMIYVGIFHKTVQTLHLTDELKHQHKTVSVANFEKLNLSSRLIVKIKQGKDCEVEIITDKNSLMKPDIENIDGTLHCSIDSTLENENSGNIQLRITMPLLQEIKAKHGTEIVLENFQADSLRIILENACVFRGKNNTLKSVSFNTSGDTRLELTSIM